MARDSGDRGRLPTILALGFSLLAISTVVACPSGHPSGPLFTAKADPSAGRALVYIYRVDKVKGVGNIIIRMDQGPELTIRDGEYIPLYVRSGGRKLSLHLPMFLGLKRGWHSVPFTAQAGGTQYIRVWAGVDEINRGPQGRPDDYKAPGRSDRYANVNVFAALWPRKGSEKDIADCQLAPGVPPTTR